MPIGSYAFPPYLVQHLLRRRPQRVLDLGMGFGGNGAAVRQWLDAGMQPFQTFLVGVEVWAEYRNPVWDLYNLVATRTIEEYLAHSDEQFDLVLLTDVVEHFDKEAGYAILLEAMRAVADGGALLISTPAKFFEQGAWHGNPYECHRSSWTADELQALGFKTELLGSPDWFCGEQIGATWMPGQGER